MPWVKLDDAFPRNRKIFNVGRDAKLLYVMALCHCASNLTDGYIEENEVKLIATYSDIADPTEGVSQLVDRKLWVIHEGGYLVHDYHDYNPTAEQVLAEREEARERMKKLRSGEVRANTKRSSVTPVPGPVPGPLESISIPPPKKQKTVGRNDHPEQFEQFWKIYPRHINKANAITAWRARMKDTIDPELLITAAQNYRDYCLEHQTDVEYIKYPSTFLGKNKGYEDFMNGPPMEGNIPQVQRPAKNGIANKPPLRKGDITDAEHQRRLAEAAKYANPDGSPKSIQDFTSRVPALLDVP